LTINKERFYLRPCGVVTTSTSRGYNYSQDRTL